MTKPNSYIQSLLDAGATIYNNALATNRPGLLICPTCHSDNLDSDSIINQLDHDPNALLQCADCHASFTQPAKIVFLKG